MRSLRIVVVVCCFWCSVSSAQQAAQGGQSGQEVFSPAQFDDTKGAIVFAADRRLDLEGTGSVELGITLEPESNDYAFPQAMTLLSHEGRSDTTFRLQIGGAGTMFGVYNGNIGRSLRYDFTVGGYFQIGLSLRDGQISVFINGEHVGVLALGFGNVRELPLIVGGQSDSRDGYLGQIHFVRFWEIYLARSQYAQTDGFAGRPEGAAWMSNHLLAYSEFTNRRASLYYGSPATLDSVLSAGLAGTNRTGTFFNLTVPANASLVGIGAVSESGRLYALTLRFIDELGSIYELSAGPGTDKSNANHTVLSIDSKSSVTGLTVGLAGDGSPMNLMLHFADGSNTDLVGSVTTPASKQRIDIPPGTQFGGLIGFDEDYIRQIGLSYEVPLPITDVSGRWILRDNVQPYKKPDAWIGNRELNGLHGTYFQPSEVMIMSPRHGGRDLELVSTAGPNRFSLTDGSGIYRDGSGAGLEFLSNNEALMDETFALIKVPPYPNIGVRDSSFNDFGGTFNLDLQIPFTSHIFHGYDIGHIDPENLQDPTPMRKPVFKEPLPTSREFYSSYQKIVPYGLLHYPDIRERSRTISHTIGSTTDYAEQMSHTIGFDIGIPKAASFGLSQTVKQRMENQSSSKTQFTVTKDIRTDRALIIDERYMELDRNFRRRIDDMATQIRLGRKPNYKDLIREYGTHYANALTVGTVSLDTVRFSSSAYRELYEKGKSMEVSASTTVRNVKVGGNFQKDNEMTDAFNKEMEQQSESFSSVGRENELVPVFLDLRRINRLLQPPFFEDELIVETMSSGLYDAIDAYIASFPKTGVSPDQIWEPYFFNVAIESAILDSDKNFTVDGVLELAAGPNNFFGDFIISGPGAEEPLTVKRLLKGRGQSNETTLLLGADGVKQVMVTAEEICGSANAPPANVTVGGEFKIDVSSRGDGSDVLGVGSRYAKFNFRELTQKSIRATHRASDDAFRPLRIMLGITIELLPDLDGNEREMPTCP